MQKILLKSKQPNWCLHTQLILECSQRRCSVVGPVSPGAAGQAILRSETNTLVLLALPALHIINYTQISWLANE